MSEPKWRNGGGCFSTFHHFTPIRCRFAKLFKTKCPNLKFQVVEFDRMSNNGSLGAYGGASSSMAVDDEVISHFRKEIGLDPSVLITPQDRKDQTLKGNNFMFELLDC